VEREALTAEVERLDREIKRLIALADGDDDIEELKVKLGEKRSARAAKVARLEELAGRQDDAPAIRMARWLRDLIKGDWTWDDPPEAAGVYRQMLGSDVPEARQTLRGFLGGGSIVVTPTAPVNGDTGVGVSFRTEGDLGQLLGHLALKAPTARTSPD